MPGQPAQAGIWFPGCAAVSPARWWQQVRQRPQVTVRLGVKVGRIREHAPREGAPAPFCWQVFDTAGALLARADVVVLACQLDSFALADMQEADHGRLRLSAACAWRPATVAPGMRTLATLPCCPWWAGKVSY